MSLVVVESHLCDVCGNEHHARHEVPPGGVPHVPCIPDGWLELRWAHYARLACSVGCLEKLTASVVGKP